MARNHNTNRSGGAWSDAEKKAVWAKDTQINGLDPNQFRNDICGKRMQFSEHGNRNSNLGWEIDHINPVSNGGSDNINNLQPLHWSNNADKADKLDWTCPRI